MKIVQPLAQEFISGRRKRGNSGQQLFINARTDAFLQKLDSPVETVIERAKLYEQSGANSLFVPGVSDAGLIRKIVSATSLPVNVVSTPAISVKALEECGVKRISMAVLLYRSTYNNMEKTAKEILKARSFEVRSDRMDLKSLIPPNNLHPG